MDRPLRVLITDDRPRSRSSLRALLTTCSEVEVEVVAEARTGREAVRLVEEWLPDVVLMDAQMPDMDGVEATRTIKSRWPRVGIIVLTMYPDYRSHALAAGADAFLLKGWPTQELLRTVAAFAQLDAPENAP